MSSSLPSPTPTPSPSASAIAACLYCSAHPAPLQLDVSKPHQVIIDCLPLGRRTDPKIGDIIRNHWWGDTIVLGTLTSGPGTPVWNTPTGATPTQKESDTMLPPVWLFTPWTLEVKKVYQNHLPAGLLQSGANTAYIADGKLGGWDLHGCGMFDNPFEKIALGVELIGFLHTEDRPSPHLVIFHAYPVRDGQVVMEHGPQPLP